MYEQYYGLGAKPFQLRPDSNFFFGSKTHKRALAYLEYGLSQAEGLVVITGDAGTGKTTLIRNFFRQLPVEKFLLAQITSTLPGTDEILRMVAGAFGLLCEDATKAALLAGIEQFLRQRSPQRAILLVDEAQNLTPQALEELRMLTNLQTDDTSLLQIFLIGQTGFRNTLLNKELESLRLRVIATCQLDPIDAPDTQAYIEHRLQTAGWQNDPNFSSQAHAEIYRHTCGIPQKINNLCNRLLLMGCLEEIHAFGAAEIDRVTCDILQEQELPVPDMDEQTTVASTGQAENSAANPADIAARLAEIELSLTSVLDILRQYPPLSGDKKS